MLLGLLESSKHSNKPVLEKYFSPIAFEILTKQALNHRRQFFFQSKHSEFLKTNASRNFLVKVVVEASNKEQSLEERTIDMGEPADFDKSSLAALGAALNTDFLMERSPLLLEKPALQKPANKAS